VRSSRRLADSAWNGRACRYPHQGLTPTCIGEGPITGQGTVSIEEESQLEFGRLPRDSANMPLA
jgi:hypothetical protein